MVNNMSNYQNSLESKLWAIADELRGNMDANEFKNYILGFIFYRYLSEKLELHMNRELKEDELTFEEAWQDDDYKEDLQEEGISALKQLKIIGEKEGNLAPTGFGLLLFGKNPQFTFQNAAIRAIYKSGAQERDMQTFGGALIEQSRKLYEWYQDKIPSHIDRNTPVRQKIYDYSIEVISELVKNAIIHRDYSISGAPIYFEINDENIIIKSPGKPVEPIKLSQIQTFDAPSLSRNPLVMFVFEKLNLAEQRGLGFGRIRQLPRAQRPVVTFEDPYIVFTLPLTNKTRNNSISPDDISLFLEEHPNFTRAQFATYFALSDKSAIRLINKMINEGIINASGEKRGVKYAKI